MKSLFSFLLIVLVLPFFENEVFAQGDGMPNRGLDDDGPHSKIKMMVIIILIFMTVSGTAFAQESAPINRLGTGAGTDSVPDYFYSYDPSPRAAERGVYPRPYSEARVLKKGILAPSPDDRTAFAGFLRQSNTGLIRLLPREVYDSHISHTTSPSRNRGGYYSFATLTHDYGYSDLVFTGDAFSVGLAGDDYGMLTILGDTPLEQITAKDPRAHFIATYKPAATQRQLGVERLRFAECWGACSPTGGGLVLDGLHYRRSMPLVENSSYLLRSISYNYSDVLVAFRVIRKDADGGVTIAWKLLQQYRAPALTRGK